MKQQNRLHFGRLSAMAAACATLALTSLPAAAVNVDAGDYTALPAGTNLGLAYYEHIDINQIRANGQKVADGSISEDIGILRGVHFMNIGGFIVDPQFLLPFGYARGSSSLQGLGSNGGLGDLILAATVWLVNNPDKKTYFGITPFIYAPTGDWNPNRALNIGNNRWEGALQAGFITPLTSNITLDLIADVAFFGHNTNYNAQHQTMSQAAEFQTQAWLRYNFTPTLDVRVGYSQSFGGKQTVAGVSQGNRINTGHLSAGVAWFPAPTWQVLATYGQDLSVQNGPQVGDQFNLRLLKVF